MEGIWEVNEGTSCVEYEESGHRVRKESDRGPRRETM